MGSVIYLFIYLFNFPLFIYFCSIGSTGVGDTTPSAIRTVISDCVKKLFTFLTPTIRESLKGVADAAANADFSFSPQYHLKDNTNYFSVGSFLFKCGPSPQPNLPYSLSSPATSRNVLRVLRGMQLRKPLLLEGSPGVGKSKSFENH
jgi:hypothetical protein